MSVIHDDLSRLEKEARMPQFIEDRSLGEKDAGIFACDLPREIINDFYNLRGHICIANARKKTKVLAITSSVPGEGSSTIATNLGFLMAGGLTRRIDLNKHPESGNNGSNGANENPDDALSAYFNSDFRTILRNGSLKPAIDIMNANYAFNPDDDIMSPRLSGSKKIEHRNEVLLVDANFRRPTLHRYFGLEQGPGLADILETEADWQKMMHLVKDSDLCVITSGKNKKNPAELFVSEMMLQFVQSVRSVFNYIIFDSPPVLNDVDAVSLSSVVDGVILIVRAGQTRWEVAQNAKHKLLSADANLLGVALNRRKASIPDGLYQSLVE